MDARCYLGLIVFMSYVIWLESKDKGAYTKKTGKITYLSLRYRDMPYRDLGKYRYLGISTYRYLYEIYTDEQSARIDSLKIGDEVTAYYYETHYTKEENVNRHLKYLDKGEKTIFKKGNVVQVIGAVVICICILLNLVTYLAYQTGIIPY